MDPEDQAVLLRTGCMAVFPRYIVENAILLTFDVPDVPCPSGPLQTNISTQPATSWESTSAAEASATIPATKLADGSAPITLDFPNLPGLDGWSGGHTIKPWFWLSGRGVTSARTARLFRLRQVQG